MSTPSCPSKCSGNPNIMLLARLSSQGIDLRLAAMSFIVAVIIIMCMGIWSVRKCHWDLRRMGATQLSCQDHSSSEREDRRPKVWESSLTELGNE